MRFGDVLTVIYARLSVGGPRPDHITVVMLSRAAIIRCPLGRYNADDMLTWPKLDVVASFVRRFLCTVTPTVVALVSDTAAPW